MKAPSLVSGKPCRAIGVFARRVVVQHQHCQPRAGASVGPFQHLLVAGRVAECRVGPATDHQVDAFRLSGFVVVEQAASALWSKSACRPCRNRVSFRPLYRPPVLAGCRRSARRTRARSPGRRRSRCKSCIDCREGIASLPASADRSARCRAVSSGHPWRWPATASPRTELIRRHAGERGGEDFFEVLHRQLRHGLAISG